LLEGLRRWSDLERLGRVPIGRRFRAVDGNLDGRGSKFRVGANQTEPQKQAGGNGARGHQEAQREEFSFSNGRDFSYRGGRCGRGTGHPFRPNSRRQHDGLFRELTRGLAAFDLGEDLATRRAGGEVHFDGSRFFRRKRPFVVGGQHFGIEAREVPGPRGTEVPLESFFEKLLAIFSHISLSN